MKTYWVHSSMGYCGTDDVTEVEAETAAEAYEQVYQECESMISVVVCETEDEAEAHGMF